MKLRIPRMAVGALVAAVALTGLGAASVAEAAQVSGTITLYGKGSATAHGPVITSGSTTTGVAYYGIGITSGCAVGSVRSDTVIVQNGAIVGSVGLARDAQGAGTGFGQTGLFATSSSGSSNAPVAMSDANNTGSVNNYVADDSWKNDVAGLKAGAFELRYYCETDDNGIVASQLSTVPYFTLALTATNPDASGYPANWSVVVAATSTTTSLSGVVNTDKTIALTATVSPTAAAGSVSFFSGTSTTAIGSGTVTNGVATFTTAAQAVGPYSFTAQYVPTGTTYSGSTSSAFTGAILGANAGTTNVTVSIPSGQGNLTLSGIASTVDLGTAQLNSAGTLLTASANLPTLTVTDTKQVGSASWTLTGQDTDFTATGATFDGGYLGWAPYVGTGSQGTAGPLVNPITSLTDTTGGLKAAARTLASGGVTNANVGSTTTLAAANLNLAVPAQTAPGAYSSVLTLTLS